MQFIRPLSEHILGGKNNDEVHFSCWCKHIWLNNLYNDESIMHHFVVLFTTSSTYYEGVKGFERISFSENLFDIIFAGTTHDFFKTEL